MMERYEVKSSELHLAFDPEQSGLTTVYLASEADARIANVIATYSLENSDLKNRAAELEREISLYKNSEFFQVCARVVDLERQLAMANDAAAKGERARLEAAGMQERIAELERATDIAIGINNDHVQRIAELEKAIIWHVGCQHDKFCDVQEGKPSCNCGHDLLPRSL